MRLFEKQTEEEVEKDRWKGIRVIDVDEDKQNEPRELLCALSFFFRHHLQLRDIKLYASMKGKRKSQPPSYREQAPTQSARRSAAPAPPSKSVAGSTGSGFAFFSSGPEAEAIATKEAAAVLLWPRKLRGMSRGADEEGRMRRPL